jgi:ligand-binding SRPBCC domain-containing protein
MILYRLDRIQKLSISLDEAWHFFSSPLNLPSITPPWLNLTILGELADRMFPGMIIRYRVTPFLGIPATWISEITHMEAPHYFVDKQRFGPYRFWHHQHHFLSTKGGIEMMDTVHYALKFGPVGRVMHAFVVKKKLEEIFDFRQRALTKRFYPMAS